MRPDALDSNLEGENSSSVGQTSIIGAGILGSGPKDRILRSRGSKIKEDESKVSSLKADKCETVNF